jgi:DNA end-binding protein Ku
VSAHRCKHAQREFRALPQQFQERRLRDEENARLFEGASPRQRTVSSNLLHKKDHSRIRYQRVSEATGKEVPAEEIVRGFEVERDNFVVISDDELKEAAPEKSAAIEIQEFVDESQIPTLYFEKPYYLEPDKGAGKAYALLREALAKSGKVGVAQFVLRNRESLCVLKAQGNALTLNTLRFASEIRSADEAPPAG